MKLSRFLVVSLHSILRSVIPCLGWCFYPVHVDIVLVTQPINTFSCSDCAEPSVRKTDHVPGTKWNAPWEAMWFHDRKDDLWWMQAGSRWAWDSTLLCSASEEKDKRSGSYLRLEREQCMSGHPVSKCQESCVMHPSIQVLVLTTRTHPGWSSTWLWVQGQVFQLFFLGGLMGGIAQWLKTGSYCTEPGRFYGKKREVWAVQAECDMLH